MKKKTLAVLLAAALGASMLWGCGKENDAGASATPASTTAESTDSSTASGTESGIQLPDLTGRTLMIYCGAGMTKPFQEIADAFKSHTGCEMNVTYANAGQIQSQITTSEEGDLFIAGSGDELKPVESYVEGKKRTGKTYTRAGGPKRQSKKHYGAGGFDRGWGNAYHGRCGLHAHWKDRQKGNDRCRYL